MKALEHTFRIERPTRPIFFHARTNGEKYILHIDDDKNGTIAMCLSENEFQKIHTTMAGLQKSIKE